MDSKRLVQECLREVKIYGEMFTDVLFFQIIRHLEAPYLLLKQLQKFKGIFPATVKETQVVPVVFSQPIASWSHAFMRHLHASCLSRFISHVSHNIKNATFPVVTALKAGGLGNI